MWPIIGLRISGCFQRASKRRPLYIVWLVKEVGASLWEVVVCFFFLMFVNILLTHVSGALGSLKGALDPLGLE